MNSKNGYRLLGFAVWQGAKWYLRRRVPVRKIVVVGALGLGVAGAGAIAAKRALG
jgi:hypothetical protein